MIDNVYINYDRCFATMIMIIITIITSKRYEYNNFKRHEYDDLNDFDENFENN